MELHEKNMALFIYRAFLRPKHVDLKSAIQHGMLTKDELEDGQWYEGYCRNASMAFWRAKDNKFLYERLKFKDYFVDSVEHPEDDVGFDLFVPMKKMENPPKLQRQYKEFEKP